MKAILTRCVLSETDAYGIIHKAEAIRNYANALHAHSMKLWDLCRAVGVGNDILGKWIGEMPVRTQASAAESEIIDTIHANWLRQEIDVPTP